MTWKVQVSEPSSFKPSQPLWLTQSTVSVLQQRLERRFTNGHVRKGNFRRAESISKATPVDESSVRNCSATLGSGSTLHARLIKLWIVKLLCIIIQLRLFTKAKKIIELILERSPMKHSKTNSIKEILYSKTFENDSDKTNI